MDTPLVRTQYGLMHFDDIPLVLPDATWRSIGRIVLAMTVVIAVLLLIFRRRIVRATQAAQAIPGAPGTPGAGSRIRPGEIQQYRFLMPQTMARTIYLYGPDTQKGTAADVKQVRVNGTRVKYCVQRYRGTTEITLFENLLITELMLEAGHFVTMIVRNSSGTKTYAVEL